MLTSPAAAAAAAAAEAEALVCKAQLTGQADQGK
jgi:hypothetical protein